MRASVVVNVGVAIVTSIARHLTFPIVGNRYSFAGRPGVAARSLVGMVRPILFTARLGLALGMGVLVTLATALTNQKCSAKYLAVNQAGTPNRQKWNDCHNAECGECTFPASTTTATILDLVALGATKTITSALVPSAAKSTPALQASSSAAYPAKIDSKYTSEPAGTQRMHTCLGSCNATKTPATLRDMKWIQEEGGYYSESSKPLEG